MIMIDAERQKRAAERVLSGELGGVRWQMVDEPEKFGSTISKTDRGADNKKRVSETAPPVVALLAAERLAEMRRLFPGPRNIGASRVGE